MKKAKKILTLALCAALLVCISVGATIAYLTSNDTVTNTFTVGNVEIELDEAKVNEDGTVVEDADRVKENDYHLMPNHTYTKDPTVTVKANSEESFVRMLVTVSDVNALRGAFANLTDKTYVAKEGNYDVFLLHELVGGYDGTIWQYVASYSEAVDEVTGKTTGTYEFRYKNTVAKSDEDTVLEPLFTSITIPGGIANADLAKLQALEIKVVAQAIQADGFADANAAWVAWGN